MSHARVSRTPGRRPVAVGVLVALGAIFLIAVAVGAPRRGAAPAPPEPVATMTRDLPEIRDTPTNLQAAFTNEMNARERYLLFAQAADAESYPAVARLFRACAKAESIHARRAVQAIAMTGQPARAMLERITVGTTQDNLRAAMSAEQYEIDLWYPALIQRARADHMPVAMRSLTLSLATERQHVALLAHALEHLEERPVAGTIYVCPFCGRTVEKVEYRKCPGCYTAASHFLRPA